MPCVVTDASGVQPLMCSSTSPRSFLLAQTLTKRVVIETSFLIMRKELQIFTACHGQFLDQSCWRDRYF